MVRCRDVLEYMLAFVLAMVVVAVVSVAVNLLSGGGFGDSGPEILIIREEYVPDLSGGGDLLLVEYSVAGLVQAETFREDQMGQYEALVGHLESVGRLRRAGDAVQGR